MLNASIALYNHSLSEIASVVDILWKSDFVSAIYLIDNSPLENVEFKTLNVSYQHNDKYVGYGSAHNIAIRQTLYQNIPYHLVINPDISFDSSILK